MDINGWLTVITVFAAVIALLPKEELFVRFYGTDNISKLLLGITNLIIIPYLLLFEEIAQRYNFLQIFTFRWGFEPKNIAFALFYISFIWLLAYLLFIKPKAKTDEKFLDFFRALLNERAFEEFFKLFTKFNSSESISDNWTAYRNLIFQPKFLKGLLQSKPTYLLQFWGRFNNENDIQSIFKLFLENPDSAYYTEIKEHHNSYHFLLDKPFLNTIIEENLKISIDNGILMVFSDHFSTHLQKEYDQTSIYNQEHYYPRIRKDEGFNLPVYYHIRFIGLLYNFLIENRVNILTISDRYIMRSYYSNMVRQMINNLNPVGNIDKEYPSNYHWLISEIFSFQGNWLTIFCDFYLQEQRYFDEKNGFISFIPSSIALCLAELYKGLDSNKITLEFLVQRMYHSILYYYLSNNLNEAMRTSIEEEIISKIPRNRLEPILTYAINEKLALCYSDFLNEQFNHSKEKEILLRLSRFLKN